MSWKRDRRWGTFDAHTKKLGVDGWVTFSRKNPKAKAGPQRSVYRVEVNCGPGTLRKIRIVKGSRRVVKKIADKMARSCPR